MGNILIAEDDDSIRELLTIWTESLGHVVHACKNGEEAFQYLNSTVPDYIITDLNMPVIDGFFLIDQLRKEPRFSKTKIIVLTGANPDEVDPFMVSAILQKPLKFKTFKTALNG